MNRFLFFFRRLCVVLTAITVTTATASERVAKKTALAPITKPHIKSSPLVLDLPEQWRYFEPDQVANDQESTQDTSSLMINKKRPKSPLGMKCHMDVSQSAHSYDSPLSSRIGGNCELGYRY